jgi:hypothetical protein
MSPPVPAGQWSWLFPHCQACGTSDEPHYARGYCEVCYHRWHSREARRKRGKVTLARAQKDARAAYMRQWRARRKAKSNVGR